MSVQQPQTAMCPSDGSPQTSTPAVFFNGERIPPDQIFDEFVFFSDEWCSGCFERIRRVDQTVAQDTDSLGTEGNVLETRQRAGSGWLGHDYEVHDQYGQRTVRNEDGIVVGTEPCGSYGLKRTYSTRTYCDNCGANNGHAPDLTVGKAEAIKRADQLVDCLLEQDIPVHRAAVKWFVGAAKERDSLSGRDHDIYTKAVVLGRREFVKKSDSGTGNAEA